MYQVRLVARWPLLYRVQLCRATDRSFMLTWGTPVCNLQRRSKPVACILQSFLYPYTITFPSNPAFSNLCGALNTDQFVLS